VVGCAAGSAPLAAQNLLYVENGGKLEIVHHAEGNTPFVLEAGKSVSRDGQHLSLKAAPEYLPALVTVLDPNFQRGMRAVSDKGIFEDKLVHAGRFVFTASLKASRALDNVVIALVLESKDIGNSLYLCGVGHLDGRESRRISIDEVTPFKLAGVHLAAVHIFVGGREAFNSTLKDSPWETELDRMVASRLAAGKDAELKPLYVVDPIYPLTLKDKIAGKAVVSCEIDDHGKVVNPAVTSATNPAFGTAALEAVRQWRFVPMVKDGHPTASKAEVPFDFTPP